MLKLPKNVLTHPNLKQIESLFSQHLKLLRPEGTIKIPRWEFSDKMLAALLKIHSTKNLIQGLESIESHLDKELKGLKALKSLPGQTQNKRLSRLLLLSNDGSERFYHNAESILIRHCDRTLGCILDASSEQIGDAVSNKASPVKALLIDDRQALENFLIQIASKEAL